MIDTNTLTDVYSILKQYIPTKDRQEAADNLMSSLVDSLDDEELKEFGNFDSPLRRALKEYYADPDDDEEYDED